MYKTKITIVGKLQLVPLARGAEEKVLYCAISEGKPGQKETRWLEVFPESSVDWMKDFPKKPEQNRPATFKTTEARDQWVSAQKTAEEEWKRAGEAHHKRRQSDPAFRRAQLELMELQHREPAARVEVELREANYPILIAPEDLARSTSDYWLYRDLVIRLESNEPESIRDKSSDVLAIKHFVLLRERQYARARREVEALENIEKLEGVIREPIPDSVRLFVWQRDKGQCIKCGSRERLEFDHIIPVVEGGSSTERNVQLLCEACNRSKGARI